MEGILNHEVFSSNFNLSILLSISLILLSIIIILWKKRFSSAKCTYVADLRDKVIVITGSNKGIGFETAKILSKMGGHIILACRNMEKANIAVKEIKVLTGNFNVEAMHLDLSSFASIEKFVQEFQVRTLAFRFSLYCIFTLSKQRKLPLHILINNAAIVCPYRTTADGFEVQFETNYLGPYLLTRLLLENLKETRGRIVIVSSKAHERAIVKLDDLQLKSCRPFQTYSNTKLYNILFSNELNRRLQGSGIVVNSVRPGMVLTDIAKELRLWVRFCFATLVILFGRSVSEGAQTLVYAAISPELEGKGGLYYSDCSEVKVSKLASDRELATQLWKISAKMCKLPEEIVWH